MHINNVVTEAISGPIAKAKAEVARARRVYEDLCKRSKPIFSELRDLTKMLEHAEELTEVELMAANAHKQYLETTIEERSTEIDEAFGYLRVAQDRLDALAT